MLRDYQRDAVVKVINDFNVPGNSIACLPTAAGKSWVIAATAKYFNLPVLILCKTGELLAQNKDKLSKVTDMVDIGTYSASANEKTIKLFTFATIGSVYKKPELFSHFRYAFVDECQDVRSDNDDSMYMQLFDRARIPKIYGISATPFLNVSETEYLGFADGKKLFETTTTLQLMNRMEDGFWKRIIYNITPKEIEELGFTVPVKYMDYPLLADNEMRLKSNQSDFDENHFAIKTRNKEQIIIDNLEHCKENYHSILVFCSTVIQAKSLSSMVENSAVVDSKTPKKERDQIISDFKTGKVKVVFNVKCLTVGFDHPSLDCLIMLRPTKSLGLWQQFVGRGVRISPETGKTKCDVIDFAGNHRRMGDASNIHLVENNGIWNVSSGDKLWHGVVTAKYSNINEHS